MMTAPLTRTLDRGATIFLAICMGAAILVPILHLFVPPSSAF
ncbi:MAG: urea ABC transporter permease subunit UrtC, partial [Alphaproteobacteria bacterium]|nr:urea ABC transporter permease subunit UrtC [Alphaproteobacteria bacterium]